MPIPRYNNPHKRPASDATSEVSSGHGAQQSPSPPAGWYESPTAPGRQQWWDGSEWTPHFGPQAANARALDGPAHVDPTFAWTLALIPLLTLPLPWVLPGVSIGSAALVTIGVNCLLAVLDQRRLGAAGVQISMLLALFLVPIYLILRTRRAGSTPAIPVVWFVSFVASVAVGGLVGPYEFDVRQVEREIARGVQGQWGARVEVRCPQDLSEAVVGETHICSVDASDGAYEATVSIDWGGYWSWQID